MTGTSAVHDYVVELHAALRGPRRVKADLVAEARDGLVDAADAYAATGMPRTQAERQAVEEFGAVRELAASYQRLLAFAQGRRTALLVFLVFGVQGILVTLAWQNFDMGWSEKPSAGYLLVADIVDWVGVASKVIGLLLLVACGIGTRYLGTRRWVPRTVAVFTFINCAFFVVAGVVMAAADPAGSLLHGNHLVWMILGTVPPLVLVLPSAWRCLRTARYPKVSGGFGGVG